MNCAKGIETEEEEKKTRDFTYYFRLKRTWFIAYSLKKMGQNFLGQNLLMVANFAYSCAEDWVTEFILFLKRDKLKSQCIQKFTSLLISHD